MGYKKLSAEELARLQNIYSNKEYLTVDEAAIWLSLSASSVRNYLKANKIAGLKFNGSNTWRIDVQKTRALISKSLNIGNIKKG